MSCLTVVLLVEGQTSISHLLHPSLPPPLPPPLLICKKGNNRTRRWPDDYCLSCLVLSFLLFFARMTSVFLASKQRLLSFLLFFLTRFSIVVDPSATILEPEEKENKWTRTQIAIQELLPPSSSLVFLSRFEWLVPYQNRFTKLWCWDILFFPSSQVPSAGEHLFIQRIWRQRGDECDQEDFTAEAKFLLLLPFLAIVLLLWETLEAKEFQASYSYSCVATFLPPPHSNLRGTKTDHPALNLDSFALGFSFSLYFSCRVTRQDKTGSSREVTVLWE